VHVNCRIFDRRIDTSRNEALHASLFPTIGLQYAFFTSQQKPPFSILKMVKNGVTASPNDIADNKRKTRRNQVHITSLYIASFYELNFAFTNLWCAWRFASRNSLYEPKYCHPNSQRCLHSN